MSTLNRGSVDGVVVTITSARAHICSRETASPRTSLRERRRALANCVPTPTPKPVRDGVGELGLQSRLCARANDSQRARPGTENRTSRNRAAMAVRCVSQMTLVMQQSQDLTGPGR